MTVHDLFHASCGGCLPAGHRFDAGSAAGKHLVPPRLGPEPDIAAETQTRKRKGFTVSITTQSLKYNQDNTDTKQ